MAGAILLPMLVGCRLGSAPGISELRDAPARAMPALLLRLERAPQPEAKAIIRQIRNGARNLASQRAAARREGIPLTARELQPPPLPVALNAAPIYGELTRLLKSKPLDPKTNQIVSALGARIAHTQTEIAAARKMLSERRDVMSLVHQAVRRPRCVFQRDWALGPGVLFPELATLREAARLLRADSYLMARDGHYREAVANLAGGFRIAEHAASDPIIIAYLVGIACDAITLDGMESLLYMADPRADVADHVRATVASNRPRFRFRRALDGEVVMSLATLRFCRQEGPLWIEAPALGTPDETLQQDERAGQPPRGDAPLTSQEQKAWKLLIDAGETEYLRRMRSAVAAAKRPYGLHRSFLQRLDATACSSGRPTDFLLTMLMTVFLPAETKGILIRAREEAVMAGAVLLAYKARHGAFPDRLDQALPQPSLDPFTDRALRYRREGAGFVVYSVGSDSTFDGGRPGARRDPVQAYFRYPDLSPRASTRD